MEPKPLQVLFETIHHGKYDFEEFLHEDPSLHYTSFRVRNRTLYSPNQTLKAFHTFLNTFLFDQLSINDRVVYAYRKGRNAHDVAMVHRSSRAFLHLDIEDFFGSIDRALVKRTILSQLKTLPITDLCQYIDRVLDLTTLDNALPLGFPTSPPISNVCLTVFDNEFEEICRSAGLLYTRYADDIIVSGPSRESLLVVETQLTEVLGRNFSQKLRLNTAKRKLTTVGRKVRILGMVILPNSQVAIDMEMKRKVEVRVHYFLRDRKRFLDICDGESEKCIQELCGYISYINSTDQKYLNKLRRKFGATVIDSFLHRTAG